MKISIDDNGNKIELTPKIVPEHDIGNIIAEIKNDEYALNWYTNPNYEDEYDEWVEELENITGVSAEKIYDDNRYGDTIGTIHRVSDDFSCYMELTEEQIGELEELGYTVDEN